MMVWGQRNAACRHGWNNFSQGKEFVEESIDDQKKERRMYDYVW